MRFIFYLFRTDLPLSVVKFRDWFRVVVIDIALDYRHELFRRSEKIRRRELRAKHRTKVHKIFPRLPRVHVCLRGVSVTIPLWATPSNQRLIRTLIISLHRNARVFNTGEIMVASKKTNPLV